MGEREALLRTALSPLDYEEVKATKLDELFHIDTETGADGLRHILTGELSGATRMPSGYHSREGSKHSLPDENGEPLTRVEKIVDENGNTIERPLWEPYRAEILVDGQKKMALKFNKKTGQREVTSASHSMFPDEYSAFMVMRTVKLARENADPALDTFQKTRSGGWYYVTTGNVPMIDGKTNMTVKVITDFDTMKVITAYPVMKTSERMNLTSEDEVMHHATYGIAPATGKVALRAPEGVTHE